VPADMNSQHAALTAHPDADRWNTEELHLRRGSTAGYPEPAPVDYEPAPVAYAEAAPVAPPYHPADRPDQSAVMGPRLGAMTWHDQDLDLLTERGPAPYEAAERVDSHGGTAVTSDSLDDTAQFRAALSSFGPRKASKLHLRLSRWKPRYWPLTCSFLIILVAVGWFTEPYAGPLGWPLSILWTWPILSTLIGIRGIRRTRRELRAARIKWHGADPPPCEDVLIVVVPTIGRHDTYPALERSILSYLAYLPRYFPRLRIDILIEQDCEARTRIAALAARSDLIRLVTIPRSYRTPNRTRFKARANHYAHELRIHQGENDSGIWVLHMDDDTGVGPDTAVAMARFIEDQSDAGAAGKHMAQGILTYPRQYAPNLLTWLADSVRPADDIARFSAMTGSGTPRAGLHGELLLIRASVEAEIGWDFGPRSIVEDAQFALIFCELYPGRSAWFSGRCYGASPASVRDFIRQRERWSWGLVELVFNRSLRLRNRALLAYSIVSWAAGPIQNVGLVLIVGLLISDANTSPASLAIVPLWSLNLAYTIWMYWEGLRLNAGVSAGGGRRRWWEPLTVILLIPVFAMMEGLGGMRGFLKFIRRTENKFVVIAKPT
jgi:glycosyl transferase family 2